jgi:TPP-dependent indolepyruvate ferredoxin oxidoreductase alpha subunit
MSHGAAMAGKRAVVLMKSHGMLKAANSVSDSLYCGVNAALLTIVFTDAGGHHSDSILDINPFLDGIGIPWQQAQNQRIYSQVQDLITESERTRLPQVLVMESAEAGEAARPAEPDVPVLPAAVPERWRRHIELYSPLFRVFRELRGEMVTGDTGISSLFACPPFDCIDITTCMGGSVPLGAGALWAGCGNVWAVTGDFAFLAAGHLGLIEARQRGLPLKVLLLRNGRSVTTGGQPVPRHLLDSVLRGYEDCLLTINDPADDRETRQKLAEAASAKGPVIVVADYEGDS